MQLRALLLAPYLSVFYPFLILRRASAAIRPSYGGAWRTWVTDSLLVGGFLLPTDARALREAGIGAVLDVSRELVAPRRSLARAGIEYLNIPCWDGRVPSMDDAARGVAFIAGHVAAGRKVYVHCASGVGRSVSLAVCYLVLHEGRDPDEALAAITRVRPRVSLSRVQRAFVDGHIAWHREREGAFTPRVTSPTARN